MCRRFKSSHRNFILVVMKISQFSSVVASYRYIIPCSFSLYLQSKVGLKYFYRTYLRFNSPHNKISFARKKRYENREKG